MRFAYAAALALVATTMAGAQQPTVPGSRNVAAITGGTYTADERHTIVTWTLNHQGFSPYTGVIGQITGSLMLDPKAPSAAKVDVAIPVSKVVTALPALTEHLVRPGKDGAKPDFFGTDMAAAHFVSTTVRVSGQGARIAGNLTFNGVTKPVTLDATLYGAGREPAGAGGKEVVGFHATGTIKRSDFGFSFGVPMVGDEVKLEISAAFKK